MHVADLSGHPSAPVLMTTPVPVGRAPHRPLPRRSRVRRRPRDPGRPGPPRRGRRGGALRDDQDVRRGHRRDVAEGQRRVGSRRTMVGRDVPRDDRTEQARVTHRPPVSPSLAGSALRPSGHVAASSEPAAATVRPSTCAARWARSRTRARRRREPGGLDLLRAHAAFGADDQDARRRCVGTPAAAAAPRVLVQHDGERGPATSVSTSRAWPARSRTRQPRPAGLLAGRPRGRGPLAHGRASALSAVPASDAPLGLPRHDHVDADLGQGLDRELAALALGQRLHHDQPRRRGGHARRVRPHSGSQGRRGRDTDSTTQRSTVPGAVAEVDRSPTLIRLHGRPRGDLRHRVSADRRRRSVGRATSAGSTRNSGRGHRPENASRGGRTALLLRALELTVGMLLAAQRPPTRAAAPPGGGPAGGGLHVDVRQQITAPGAAQVRHTTGPQRDDVTGLGAGPDLHLLRAVEGLQRAAPCPARRRSSAASTEQCRSSPLRWNTGCGRAC